MCLDNNANRAQGLYSKTCYLYSNTMPIVCKSLLSLKITIDGGLAKNIVLKPALNHNVQEADKWKALTTSHCSKTLSTMRK